MNVIQKVEQGAITLWHKIKTLFDDNVEPVLSEAEKEIVALFEPLVKSAEATALADLKAELTTFLKSVEKGLSLPDLETAFVNSLKSSRADLMKVIEGLGSTLFQALIGLVLSKLV